MTKATWCIILFAMTVIPAASAQNIKVVNSSKAAWSGGIAGMSGVNYTFTIEFSSFKKEPVPDTIWIGQKPIAIIITDSGILQHNTKRISVKNAVTYEIRVGTSNDEYGNRYPVPGPGPQLPAPHAPIPYKGVALLSYRYNDKQYYHTVNKIMKTYPPVSYP